MKITGATLIIYGLIIITGQAYAAEVAVTPSTLLIPPNTTFNLNISIDPNGTAIAGAQLDIAFNPSLIKVNNITEGDLFKQGGANTFFNSGVINNSTGTVNNIFSTIIGKKNVTTRGNFIIINLTAIGTSGTSAINLSNVRISDPAGNPVGLNVTNGSIRFISPPLMISIGNRTVNEGQLLTFNISAADPDEDTLVYSATNMPDGASFNLSTRIFLWTPNYTQSGNYSIRFDVTDGFYTVQESVNITVFHVNRAPNFVTVFNNLTISNITNANGRSYVLDTLSTEKLVYIDRNYTITSVPSLYKDLQYIRTANDDKNSTGNSFLEFDVNRDVTVYVAHDNRISPKPSWLLTFTDTGDDLSAEKTLFSIYAKRFSNGHIILGGNYGNSSSSMYTVLVGQNNSIYNETDNINISIKANDPDIDTLSYIIRIDGSLVSTSSDYAWNTNYSSSGYHTIEISVSDGMEVITREFTVYINNVYPRYDIDENGIVDIADLVIIGQNLNKIVSLPYPRYDVNMDGIVDIFDITITAQRFGDLT